MHVQQLGVDVPQERIQGRGRLFDSCCVTVGAAVVQTFSVAAADASQPGKAGPCNPFSGISRHQAKGRVSPTVTYVGGKTLKECERQHAAQLRKGWGAAAGRKHQRVLPHTA